MRFLPAQGESRREFFRAGARYSLLAVIAAVAGFVGRSRATGKGPCAGRSLCGQCLALVECELPQARRAREQRSRLMGQ